MNETYGKNYQKRIWFSINLVLIVSIVLTGCTAGGGEYSADKPADFWAGLWHGAISIVMLIAGIFSDTTHVYEVNNNGGWYDFGFLFGAITVWGSARHGARWGSRKSEFEYKMEKVFSEKCRQWAEEEGDKEWEDIAKKVEKKVKRKVKEWAEKED